MNWRDSAIVITISGALALAVVVLFWVAHQKDTHQLVYDQVLQNLSAEAERELANSRVSVTSLAITNDTISSNAIGDRLEKAAKILKKMAT